MRTEIKGRHFDLTDELRQLVEEKIFAPVEKYIDEHDNEATFVDVTLEYLNGVRDGIDNLVHVTIILPHDRNPIHIDETDKTMAEAINKTRDRVEKLFQRHKEKHNHHA